jgi:hypothetical protein
MNELLFHFEIVDNFFIIMQNGKLCNYLLQDIPTIAKSEAYKTRIIAKFLYKI